MYVRWKSGFTFVRRCFRDVLKVKLMFYSGMYFYCLPVFIEYPQSTSSKSGAKIRKLSSWFSSEKLSL